MDGQAESLGDTQAITNEDPLISIPKDCNGIEKMQAFALGNKKVLQKGVAIVKASETDGVGNENKKSYLGAICE
jgi:hypothetical protein